MPVHWHGTHVAGIIAGDNQEFHGIAPDAKIIAINIFDKSGASLDQNVVKALAYIVSLTSDYNIAAVNMSLGTPRAFTETCDTYLPAVTAEIHNLRIKNVATVISSGNNYLYCHLFHPYYKWLHHLLQELLRYTDPNMAFNRLKM